MTTICGLDGCARPAPTATVCDQHIWEVERSLRGVPALMVELNVTLSRQSKSGPATEKVGGKGETGVYFNPLASEAHEGLRSALTGWATTFVCPGSWWTAHLAARELLRVLPDSRARGDLPALVDEIRDAYGRAERAIDSPANRTIIPVGPCPEGDDHGPCGGQVSAFIPADDRPARMACDTDADHWWSSVQWLRVGKRIRDLVDQRARQAGASA